MKSSYMKSSYMKFYNSIKNYKFDDDTIAIFPGVVISICLVIYANS